MHGSILNEEEQDTVGALQGNRRPTPVPEISAPGSSGSTAGSLGQATQTLPQGQSVSAVPPPPGLAINELQKWAKLIEDIERTPTPKYESAAIILGKMLDAGNVEDFKVRLTESMPAWSGRNDNLAERWLTGAGNGGLTDAEIWPTPKGMHSLSSKLKTAVRAMVTGTPLEDQFTALAKSDPESAPSALVYLRKMYEYLAPIQDNSSVRAITNWKLSLIHI